LSEKQSERQVTDFTNVQRFGEPLVCHLLVYARFSHVMFFPHNDLAFCSKV